MLNASAAYSTAVQRPSKCQESVSKENKMVRTPDRYEIITDHNEFLSLKRHWHDLYERSTEHDLTQSFEWCRCSWEIVAKPQGRRLHCLVAWRRDRAVLIWPFVTCRHGRFLRTFARPLGPETSEYSSVLVEDGSEADRRILFGMGYVTQEFAYRQNLIAICQEWISASPRHCGK